MQLPLAAPDFVVLLVTEGVAVDVIVCDGVAPVVEAATLDTESILLEVL